LSRTAKLTRVHRLATRPDWRGRGIASGLLAELERRLLAIGCPKVNLLIEADNAGITSFYAAAGYRSRELGFMEKWLVPAPDDLLVPNGHPCFAPATDPAAGGWRDIEPDHTNASGEHLLRCPR
jgi:GNAT superfamily N-acetyltransferase